MGNYAVMKCIIPSFVADLVDVVSWENDDGNLFTPGTFGKNKCKDIFDSELTLKMLSLLTPKSQKKNSNFFPKFIFLTSIFFVHSCQPRLLY